jgi:hypothetical protein
MEFLQGEDFDRLFRTFERTAFHLEVQDLYHTPEEAGPFGRFLAGEPDDFGWHRPWLRLVADATRAGKRITRVRVVTVPHVPYTRWGLTVAPLNIEAGEDIRWLPRHLTSERDLTADDYWLFDDRRVVFTIFEPTGRFAGGAATSDPRITEYCKTVRRTVWDRAIPHDRYVTGAPVAG